MKNSRFCTHESVAIFLGGLRQNVRELEHGDQASRHEQTVHIE